MIYNARFWVFSKTVIVVRNCCSVAKSCLTLRDIMDCSMPGFHVLHCLPGFAQVHFHVRN